jgi:hypothetical protein
MFAWELNPELGSCWLKASATLVGGGGSLRLKASMIGCSRACFHLYLGICLATEEKHGKPQSGYERKRHKIDARTGEGWKVPLANRKRRGSDPAPYGTTIRRETWLWLRPGATGIGVPVGSPDLADKE